MLSLLLESCTERSIIALMEDTKCLYFAGLPFGLHHSQYLLPKMEEGFSTINKHPRDLGFITVGIGPGSYTGIRVCASIAKSLSFACKIPLIGICSLEGFIPDRDCAFAALIDAKMAGVYLLRGERKNHHITYTSTPEICSIENVKPKLEDVEVLVAPFIPILKTKFDETYPGNHWIWEESAPDPLHLTARALSKYEKNDYSLDGSLQLLYMRE